VAVAALAVATAWGGLAAAAPRKPAHQARPAVRTAARTTATTTATTKAKAKVKAKAKAKDKAKADPADPPIAFDSEFNGGQFVTQVSCSSTVTPAPVHVGLPGAPLTLSGTGPSAGAAHLLTKPGGYKTVYVCTIIVKKRAAKKFHLRKVVISTGFGGEAGSVARHHPAG
jgi:hypothetical protein